jgi:hypothetical protein
MATAKAKTAKPGTFKFKVKLESPGPEHPGAWTFMPIPLDIPKIFGTRGRVPVRGTINGFPFRTSISPMGGRHLMTVNKTMREGAKADQGDTVSVVLERDDQPREVEVPVELAQALVKAKVAKQFDEMSYSCRKEYCAWVADAKKDETRERRIAKAVEMIREKKKFKG